uniref:Uncharacterized protein n=1 Tax=Rhizophora mucronata TaxID=61149 RepID=A0A2P2PF03_RHIMU
MKIHPLLEENCSQVLCDRNDSRLTQITFLSLADTY